MSRELDINSQFCGHRDSSLTQINESYVFCPLQDHYLAAPYDISRALFIATANDLSKIPRPLLDRMEIIQIPSYSLEEKIAIAKRHLIPKMEKLHGLNEGQVQISSDALFAIVQQYTQEAGVRTLERKIAAVCRYVALAEVGRDDLTEQGIGW